jgi:CheY-like chemotaxis protein
MISEVPLLKPILIADDDADDVFLTQWVLQQLGIENPIVTVEDGQDAIDFLSGCIHAGRTPCVALLDLKMPKRNGFSVLEWIQSQPALAGIRCIVLAGSDLTEDRRRAGELDAFAYFVKYDTCSELPQLLRHDCPGISIQGQPVVAEPATGSDLRHHGAEAGLTPRTALVRYPGNTATA